MVFVNNQNFNGFIKAALAFGGLRKALEAVGASDVFGDAGTADKIAAVDAAYQFASATDDFKLWLAAYLDKAELSPFLTARTMDEAARNDGAVIDWGLFAGAALDDVGLALATLEKSLAAALEQQDSDTAESIKEAIATLTEAEYVPSEDEIGETFDTDSMTLDGVAALGADADQRVVSAAQALRQYFQDFLASDGKFASLSAGMGDVPVGDAFGPGEAKSQLRTMIALVTSGTAGIADLTAKEGQRLADFANDARVISDLLTGRGRRAGAQNLLRTPEMKTSYPDIDSQPTLDSVALDATGGGYVGKIKKGGEVVGRVDIDSDGKAVVYVAPKASSRLRCLPVSLPHGQVIRL